MLVKLDGGSKLWKPKEFIGGIKSRFTKNLILKKLKFD